MRLMIVVLTMAIQEKHLDNWIDIAGYAGVTGQAIIEDQILPFKKDGLFK